MKRRIISFITVLAMCLSLCPTWALAAGWEPDLGLCPHHWVHTEECGYSPEDAGAPCMFVCRICPIEDLTGKLPRSVTPDNMDQVREQLETILALYTGLTADEQEQVDLSRCLELQVQLDAASAPMLVGDLSDFGLNEIPDHEFDYDSAQVEKLASIKNLVLFNIQGTYTAPNTGAFQVISTGRMYIKGNSKIVAEGGSGIEVLTGGQLHVIGSQVAVTGSTYGVDIQSGATVQLGGGTYTGKEAAIRTADGKFENLLKPGYAFFDESGNPIPLTSVKDATTVVVKECTSHLYTYTHDSGTPTHSWVCEACGAFGTSERCTFNSYVENADKTITAECGQHCGHAITIEVDEKALGDLIYNGANQTAHVTLTVTLDGGTNLQEGEGKDYTVACTTRQDVGEITVTVTGGTYSGTFTKAYYVSPDKPVITWDVPELDVNYDSRRLPVDASLLLQHIKININAPEDLSSEILYSYQEIIDGVGTDFMDGLPTNAGTYKIKARLPEQQNYEAAESAPLPLTINKISPIKTAPTGKTVTYNQEVQELVNAGALSDDAVYDGAVLEYASAQTGPYSTNIPTGMDVAYNDTGVADYTFWYHVKETENYFEVTASVTARINVRNIKPEVELEYYTCLFDGGDKEPKVTVKDTELGKTVPDSEYQVKYSDNRNAGTATVTVTDAANGNYDLIEATATFKITAKPQDVALSITNMPNTVTYGDVFTLGTSGGSGNGAVTWEITTGKDTVATVDPISGQVTINSIGTATVQATKSGTSGSATNYPDAVATWTFTVNPKPVTAVATAEDIVYDGKTKPTTAVTVALPGTGITDLNVTGEFANGDVGTNKTVTIKYGTSKPNNANYTITYPSTTTASITPAPASASGVNGIGQLKYTGSPQALVTAGTATGGKMEYSLDGITYGPDIPVGTDAKIYNVRYKVRGDGNHTDSEIGSVSVEISQKDGTPTVELMPPSVQYDGNVHRPEVVVSDKDTDQVIPKSEYKVTYETSTGDWKDKGSYIVTITNLSGGNYNITTTTATFTISEADSQPLTIVNKPGVVYFGDSPFTLSAVGGSGEGAITWKSSNTNAATVDANGLVTIKNAGEVTITATKAASENYTGSTATYAFTVQKQLVKDLKVELSGGPFTYNGGEQKPDVTVMDGTTVIPTGQYDVSYSDNENAGTATVTVTSKNYAIDKTVTFTIDPKRVTATIDKTGSPFTYNGSEQKPVVTVKDGLTDVPTTEYKVSYKDNQGNAVNSPTNAGIYTVTVEDIAGNYFVEGKNDAFTIEPAEPSISTWPTATGSLTYGLPLSELQLDNSGVSSVPGTFHWTDDTIRPEIGTADQEVTFTPSNTQNYTEVTGNVSVTVINATVDPPESGSGESGVNDPTPGDSTNTSTTPAPDEPSAASTPAQDSTVTTAVDAAAGDALVDEALASQSENVVIKPEITGDVTKAEVSLPVSTVSRLSSETKAALTVSTPIADVTIPNAALDTLSSAGSDVSVVTEQVGNAVTVTLAADGQTIDSIPGGLTLTVPVEDAAPGTVAVLVHEDGTRETIRKSVAADGTMSIPLDGSATIEIVDNSKTFADVPAENWAADAVAFASAHELFNGTSETTFSPDEPMSRAMLATVLYNLEGRPDQGQTSEFSDVSSDSWYAAGVSWASENGITNGYGDGQFGPDDNVTREQLAVMLWKYAESPAPAGQDLDFTDADQVSGYALEALCWASENGILNGHDDGRLDPSGLATRAEAAQMLKNFMENT